ncbi:glycosyltransferase [Novosphingobium taihuense]|uniref:Alpha-1,6-mannosyltransferase n=1 Tax=Novosphingobium taihuense TaxID=260085 RepID=A0A7W7AEB0_9SPHN|nr:glycosyltransferase [Novosphingobium taihuense]MBB4615281.1 alpha-1,6-mannosyltransferase [Novosphingobium taihuense]TWH84316.1 alpha-1,6-mannosyltransferase [Novosphingobium taihuense]
MSTPSAPLLICDLTQSYAPHGGGGIGTYLREKQRHVIERTGHRLLQIVPGPEDRVIENGRHIWVEVGAEQVRGSPNYRFIMRTKVVRDVLEHYRPDLIESQCPWVLPWTAINYRRAFPDTALVAGYHTDFPNAHIYRVGSSLFGEFVGRGLRRLAMGYAELTYREFDRVYTLSEAMADVLRGYRIEHVDVVSLGVDTALFHPDRRDPEWRKSLGLSAKGPLLVYAGRIDNEKRADRLLAMFRRLPVSLDAGLVMIGDGKLREALQAEALGLQVAFPGFLADRTALARALASSDIYVSAMADETFGISVIEAQASGLPVVGVRSGAMIERVVPGTGILVGVDDAVAMAAAVERMWQGGRAQMGGVARAHVAGRFEWSHTFDALLGEVYPEALHRARQRTKKGRASGTALSLLGNGMIRRGGR